VSFPKGPESDLSAVIVFEKLYLNKTRVGYLYKFLLFIKQNS